MKNETLKILISAFAILLCGCSRISPEEAVARGQRALYQGHYEEAIEYLEKAAKTHGSNPKLYFNLGMANLYANHNRAAERAFLKSCELGRTSDSTSALEGLAEARRRRGKYNEAIEAFRMAIKKDHRKPCLLAGYAACEMELGNLGAAERLLTEALQNDPREPVALYNDAVLHMREKCYDQARAAKNLYLFIISERADRYKQQKQKAVERLAKLNAMRPVELQDKIDSLLMQSFNSSLSFARRMELLEQAISLDLSYPGSLARLIRLRQEVRPNDPKTANLIDRFNMLYPYDQRFRN